MFRASDFEFRNRWWFFSALYGAPFFSFAFDRLPTGVRIAHRLAAAQHWPADTAYHFVFGLGAALAIVGGLIRTWGSSYLSLDVVHDGVVHSDVLRASGPYRYTRNPLYLGNVLLSFGMGIIAPVAGCAVMIAGVLLFTYRLIGREEAGLEAQQGDAFRAFAQAVPRLLPSLRPRIAAGSDRPDWKNGIAAEVYFWSFVIGITLFAATLNVLWFYGGIVLSPIASAMAKRSAKRTPHASSAEAGK